MLRSVFKLRQIAVVRMLLKVGLGSVAALANADEQDELNAHAAIANAIVYPADLYISSSSYTQNPYSGFPSSGDTQHVSESQLATHNVAQKWFSDGTWNVMSEASYVDQTGSNNFGYGVNIFAQTGFVAGFSFGGFFTIMNPVFASTLDPSDPLQQAQGLPVNQQITTQELFTEYQFSNIVEANLGWIGINNSPWLTYYQNNALNLITYQGASFNVHPGGGWLVTGLFLNGVQQLGSSDFNSQTFYGYNSVYSSGGLIAQDSSNASSGTAALGANWSVPDNSFSFRLWGYQFENYANLAYADSTLKFVATDDLSFTIGMQGAIEGSGGGNVLENNGYGSANSNMVGLMLGLDYSIFGIQIAYNNIWGPSTAYGGGDLVSPYTYQYASDPLYTTGWLAGMIEKSSAGSAYKIAPSLSLLNSNLIIGPSYEYYATSVSELIPTSIPATSEYDLQITYKIPQIKGLTIFAGSGYLLQPEDIGGNIYSGQVMVSYLY